jgi:hypothetical protein
LPHTAHSLGHAVPALCREHVGLNDVLHGPCPYEKMVERMRRSVKEHNIYWWAASLIGTLCELRLDHMSDAKSTALERVLVEK